MTAPAVSSGATVRKRLLGLAQLARSDVGQETRWAIVDQVTSSAGNVALGVVLARQLTPTAFGAFGVAFAIYVLALCASRALSSSVLQVRFSARPAPIQRQALRDSMGVPVLLTLLVVPVLLVVWATTQGPTPAAVAALAIIMPALLLQDSLRLALIAFRRARAATLNDLTWLVIEFALLGSLLVTGRLTLLSGLLAWGLGAYGGVALGFYQTSSLPAVRRGVLWFRTHRDFGLYTLGEFLLLTGTAPLMLLIIGALVGLADVAALRAADLIINPLNLLITALLLVALPELSRLRRAHLLSLPTVLNRAGAALAAMAVAFGVVAYLLPSTIGAALVGPNWAAAHPVLPLLAVHFAAVAVMTAALTGLRVLEAAKAAFLLRLLLSPFYVAAGVAGMLVGGPVGCVAGSTMVSIFGAWSMRRSFARAFAQECRSQSTPLDPDGSPPLGLGAIVESQ